MRTANLRRVRNNQQARKCFMDGGRMLVTVMQPGRQGINGDGKKPVTLDSGYKASREPSRRLLTRPPAAR